MPQKPESRYIGKVRKTCHNSIYSVKFNDNFTAGIPDCYFSGVKSGLWAEFKWYPYDKKTFDLTSGKRPKLSRLQQHWLNGRLFEGRDPWIVIGFPSGGVVLSHGEWNNTITADGHYLTIREVADLIEDRCGICESSSRSHSHL